MPGLIGFVGNLDSTAGSDLLGRMARALEHEDRFRRELYSDRGIALGRVTLGLVSPRPQPVWNEDHTICLVMEGELFDTAPLRRDLVARGHRFEAQDDAALMVHLYEEYGPSFARKLNGAFVAALWDAPNRRLVVTNDRLALHPLYYIHGPDGLRFASGVRALLADPAVPRCVDPIAVAQFLTFDHLLGERTLIRNARTLPGGSVLTFQEHGVDLTSYWAPLFPRHYTLRSQQEWMDLLVDHLRQAVARRVPNGQPAGILLSGGLDSRVLLALLKEEYGTDGFHSFSWGIPGCDDARFAREVADRLGSRHHFFELKPDWLATQAEECVRATDGMGNIVNLHARATLEEQTRFAPLLYKGFLGDAMMGYAQRHQHWAEYEEQVQLQAHLEVHNSQGVVIFHPKRHDQWFTEAFRAQIGDGVLQSYREGMAESGARLLADQRIYYDYRQRVPRHTLNGVEVMRQHAAVRLPFADNDLVELMLQVPPGLRFRRELMNVSFVHAFPELARIPVAGTGLPMSRCARELRVRTQQFARWHLRNAGLPVAYPGNRPYKDYDRWFRGVLRDWVEGLLLSDRALERGYLDPARMRSLVGEHMAGGKQANKLGVLLTLELWHRQFIDQ